MHSDQLTKLAPINASETLSASSSVSTLPINNRSNDRSVLESEGATPGKMQIMPEIETVIVVPFIDPSKPSPPQDTRPLWKIQEERRKVQVRRKLLLKATVQDLNHASLNGLLIGHRLAKPPDMRKQMHQRRQTVDARGNAIIASDDHKFVADVILTTADQGTQDRSVSINELQVFLKGTPYKPFMEWLTGISDGNSSRFHELDNDGSSSIEAKELEKAVAEFYTLHDPESFPKILEHSTSVKKDMAEKAERMVNKREAERRKSVKIIEMKQDRENKRKMIAARRLTSDASKLNQIQFKILAASYTSFNFNTDFEMIFKRFDADHSGTLDFKELKNLVRKILKVPPRTISNDELTALFMYLDEDGGGRIDQEEMAAFLKNGDPKGLPDRMKHIGRKLSPRQELCALINFKSKSELKRQRREPRAPPGEIPWNNSVKCRMSEQFAGIGHQGFVPLSER